MLKVNKLKNLRENNNFTLKEIAEKLGYAENTIHNWESGKRNPDTETLAKLSKIYDVSMDELLESSETYKEAVWLSYNENKERVDRIIGSENVEIEKDEDFGIFIDNETHEWLGSARVSFEIYDGDLDAHIYSFLPKKSEYGKFMLNAIWEQKWNGEDVTCITGASTKEMKKFWEELGATFDSDWEEIEDVEEVNHFHIYDRYL